METGSSKGESSAADAWTLRVARTAARIRADISFAIIDAVLIVMAYTAALTLRFADAGGGPPAEWWGGLAVSLPVIIAVHLGANLLFDTYGHVWEYASVEEALRIVAASATAALMLLLGLLTFRGPFGGEGLVPISVLVIGAMLTLAGMGLVRFRSRLFSLKRMSSMAAKLQPGRTLVVGTGRAAAELIRYGVGMEKPMRVVGVVDPKQAGSARRLAGVSVLGTVADVPELVEQHAIDQVIIADPAADELARELVDRCMHTDVRLRILPDIDAVLSGDSRVRDVRDLEITDLLPRPTVQTDLRRVANFLQGKRVLVTGAGGSIGSEMVRQILEFDPASLVAVDNDETHLYEAMLEWGGFDCEPSLVLADIRDTDRLMKLFEQHRPEVVFHAAAHKHVPILESCPEEAVKTNTLGTAGLLAAARTCAVRDFVLISTDKAVDPSSVMGASKRVAEMMVQREAATYGPCTLSAVRFGNVLGSRGSVVPTFLKQIEQGGPVTVSDPRMERYFMTVDEAVQLVLQAAAVAEGGEVFVLEMGERVQIIDLAHRLIRLAGMVPNRDIDVVITGARPGEKIQELVSTTPLEPSGHPNIGIARPGYPGSITLMDAVSLLAKLADAGESEGIRAMLTAMTRETWEADEHTNLLDEVGMTAELPASDLDLRAG